MDEVKLTVPAMPEFIHLMRAVVASVAARQDLSLDSIDDLTIAVDEAAAYLMGSDPSDDIVLKVGVDEGSVVARVSVPASSQPWPPPEGKEGLAWKVMEGLADKADFESDGDRRAIRLTKAPGSMETA